MEGLAIIVLGESRGQVYRGRARLTAAPSAWVLQRKSETEQGRWFPTESRDGLYGTADGSLVVKTGRQAG